MNIVKAVLAVAAIITFAGCTTPTTLTKSWTEETSPSGKTVTRSEKIVQVKQTAPSIQLEHVR